MSSLKRRAVAAAAVTAAVALAVSGAAIHLTVRSVMTSAFDADLAARARALAGLVVVDSGRLEAVAPSGSEYAADGDAFYVVRDLDGATIARSASLPAQLPVSLPALQPAAAAVVDDHIAARAGAPADLAPGPMGTLEAPAIHVDVVHDAEARVATAMWTVRHDGRASRKEVRAVVSVARLTAPLERVLGRLAWLLGGVTASVAAACGLAMAVVVARALVPLDRLAERIGALDDRSLGRRLGLGAVPLELLPVVSRLDGLLARLDQAFTREKVFSAAVAHELRTPIAGLRATIDVCRSREREPADYQRALGDCQEICTQMQAMVESLLLLARLDTGQVEARGQEFDLVASLGEWWRPYADAAAARGLRVAWDLAGPLPIDADPALLRVVAANLFDNAVSHADQGGEVRIECLRSGPEAVLRVANTGCALSADQAGRVFDRFWRGDASRGATGRHCGLGLSLCLDLAKVLRGRIGATVGTGGWFTVHVAVPAPTPAESQG